MTIRDAGLVFGQTYTRSLADLRYIVVHHTDSQPDVTPETIHRWHLQRGWSGCGYHYLVYRDGAVYRCRRDAWVPACVQGYNRVSLCVALVGSFDAQPPSPRHLQAALALVRLILRAYPKCQVVRHSDLAETRCPGIMFPWQPFLAGLKEVKQA